MDQYIEYLYVTGQLDSFLDNKQIDDDSKDDEEIDDDHVKTRKRIK